MKKVLLPLLLLIVVIFAGAIIYNSNKEMELFETVINNVESNYDIENIDFKVSIDNKFLYVEVTNKSDQRVYIDKEHFINVISYKKSDGWHQINTKWPKWGGFIFIDSGSTFLYKIENKELFKGKPKKGNYFIRLNLEPENAGIRLKEDMFFEFK